MVWAASELDQPRGGLSLSNCAQHQMGCAIPLPLREVEGIAKSVVNISSHNLASGQTQARFSQIQAAKGQEGRSSYPGRSVTRAAMRRRSRGRWRASLARPGMIGRLKTSHVKESARRGSRGRLSRHLAGGRGIGKKPGKIPGRRGRPKKVSTKMTGLEAKARWCAVLAPKYVDKYSPPTVPNLKFFVRGPRDDRRRAYHGQKIL